jgi:hypothetical protein
MVQVGDNIMYDSEVEEYIMFERETLHNMLTKNVVRVTFNKVNGEQRIMDCTLLEDVVPETKGNKKENSDVMNVWDVKKNDWRSFRVANVTDFELVNK